MATKEELYSKFGPILLEAIVCIMLNEINALRQNAGLSLRTSEQVINAISNELSSIIIYDWMDDI